MKPISGVILLLGSVLASACSEAPVKPLAPRQIGEDTSASLKPTATSRVAEPRNVTPTHALSTTTGSLPRSAVGIATATTRVALETPVASAAAFDAVVWSPTGRSFVVASYSADTMEEVGAIGGFLGFVQGAFGVHDIEAGETCWAYEVETRHGHEGPSPVPYMWLSDGRLMATTLDGRVLLVGPACNDAEDITARMPIVPTHYGAAALDGRSVVLGDGWWLLDPTDLSAVRIESVPGDLTDQIAWSPDGRHVAVTISGVGDNDLSGTRIVNASSGKLMAAHDWQGYSGIGGVFGDATWVSDSRVVVPITVDQGPLFLDLDGAVSSALEPFGEVFEPAPVDEFNVEEFLPEVQGRFDSASGAMHLLLIDPFLPGSKTSPRLVLFHGETGQLESFGSVDSGVTPWLTEDGQIEVYEGSVASKAKRRPLDPPGSAFAEVLETACIPIQTDQTLLPRWQDLPYIEIVNHSCDVVDRLRLPGTESPHVQMAKVSPDGRHLVAIVRTSPDDPQANLYVVALAAPGNVD